MPGHILLAADDRSVRLSRVQSLNDAGYDVQVCLPQLTQLTASLTATCPEVTILDGRGSRAELLALCRAIRRSSPLSELLVLSGFGAPHDRIAGLDAGADEWLPAECSRLEVLAYLRVVFRRLARADRSGGPEQGAAAPTVLELELGDLRLHPATRRVWRGGLEVTLSHTEYDLLEFLVRHPDTVLSRATIHEQVWGYDFGRESKNLSVYISYLRRKIGTRDQTPLIHTVRGCGYLVRTPLR